MPAEVKSRSLLGVLALLTIAGIAFFPTLRNGYIWDDSLHITSNATLIERGGLARIWTEVGATPQYYPLTFTLFWLEYRLWGPRPVGYHAVNVLLHGINAALLYLVLAELGLRGAWLAAALFAVHPVQVETVAWVTEHKNLLSGLFYLLSLRMLLRWAGVRREGDRTRRGSALEYGASLALFAVALLCKTVASTLPLVAAALLWWKRGRLALRELLPLAPFLLIGASMGLFTVYVERVHVGAAGPEFQLSIAERILVAGRALLFYPEKLLWPANLMFVYPRWTIRAADLTPWLFPTLAGAVVTAAFLVSGRTGRGPATALVSFGVTLFPALGFFNVYPMRYSFVADHFQYLACAALFALAAESAARATVWLGLRNSARLAVALLVLALGVKSWSRCAVFQDEASLWRDTLQRNPEASIASNNLGAIVTERAKDGLDRAATLAATGRPRDAEAARTAAMADLEEARRLLRSALSASPSKANALNNLARSYIVVGDYVTAQEHLEAALAANPEYGNAHNSLGECLYHLGRYEEAAEHFELAIRFGREKRRAGTRAFPEANLNLGLARIALRDVAGAADSLEQALRERPGYLKAHVQLGLLRASSGQMQDATRHLVAAVDGGVREPRAVLVLAWIRATHPDPGLRDPEQALILMGQLGGSSPPGLLPFTLLVRGAVYAGLGRFPEARAEFDSAIALSRQKDLPALRDAAVRLRSMAGRDQPILAERLPVL